MSELHRFVVTDGSDVAQLAAGLEQRLGLQRDPVQHITREMLDTFDWRVHASDSLLEHRRRAGAPDELVWCSLRTGEVFGRLEIESAPSFVWDLPVGPVSDRLASVLEMRALTGLATVESSRTVLRLVDDEDKTTARLVVDQSSWNGRELPTVIEVLPVRGYAKAAEGLAALLDAQVVLDPGAEDPLHTALVAAGLRAGAYCSKLRISLDPGTTALEAWVEVLRTLTSTILANTPGVMDDLDSEFLHDYRVAVRRIRSVLSQAKRVLPPEVLARFRPEFARLGEITGPTRDFDVYLLTLPFFEEALPAERRSHLKPFGVFLERHQRDAHAALVAELGSSRYAQMIQEWQGWLDSPELGATAPLDALSPAVEVAARRIWRAHRRLVRSGRTITAESPGEDLHELRKDAKRLRYLLECFGSLYPQQEVSRIVKELKGLQDVLGEFQDCEIQAASLEMFGQDLLEEGEATASTLIAMGYLVEQLDERRRVARDAFASRFARFDSKSVRRATAAVFRRPSAPQQMSQDVDSPEVVSGPREVVSG